MTEPRTDHHPYRGNAFAGRPCLECGLSPEFPTHRVPHVAHVCSVDGKSWIETEGPTVLEAALLAAARKVIAEYDARSLWHVVDYEPLTEAMYALDRLASPSEPT